MVSVDVPGSDAANVPRRIDRASRSAAIIPQDSSGIIVWHVWSGQMIPMKIIAPPRAIPHSKVSGWNDFALIFWLLQKKYSCIF